MDTSKRVAQNTIILYARIVITLLISLYTTRLTLSVLGEENFGLFGLVGGSIAMLGFLNASMASATQRFMSFAQGTGETDKPKRIFATSIFIHLITSVVVLLVLEVMGYFYFHGILNIAENRQSVAWYIYQFMVISTLFTIVSVPYEAVMTAHENMLSYAVLSIIESILKLLIVSALAYSTLDHLLLYGGLMAALPIFLLLLRQLYCHRHYTECTMDLRKYYDKNLFQQMSHFGAWSFLGTASTLIANYGQSVVLNIFFGTAINASQSIANQLNGQLSVLAANMLKALNPLIDKSAGAGNRTLMLKATLMGSKLSFFLIMALHIPVIIEMPFILQSWLHTVPASAIIFCRLLLARSLIEHLFFPLVSAIAAVGDIKAYQITSALLTLAPLPVSFYLLQTGFPDYYLYLVFLVYAALASMVILYYAVKNCKLQLADFFFNVLLRCAACFIIVFSLACIPYFYLPTGWQRCVVTFCLSSLSYLLAIWFFGFSTMERQKIAELIFSLFKKLGTKKCLP